MDKSPTISKIPVILYLVPKRRLMELNLLFLVEYFISIHMCKKTDQIQLQIELFLTPSLLD